MNDAAATERERRLLQALALMAEQYLNTGEELDTLCMSAGETTIAVFEDYGLVKITRGGRCAKWTDAGAKLLASS